jgi:biofilm PGA synthesis N-glycosyltransferase PgaC
MTYPITDILLSFAYYYPLFMAYLWLVGAIYFYIRWERGQNRPELPPTLEAYPSVSIIVPCYNESNNIIETIEALEEIIYPSFEIIAVNDGSSDDTGKILNELGKRCPHLRVHAPCSKIRVRQWRCVQLNSLQSQSFWYV